MKNILVKALVALPLGRLNSDSAKHLVRRWAARLFQHTLKMTSARDTMPPVSSIVVAPHPDDETLGCGALIARKRSLGLPVDVVFPTNGDASHLGQPRITRTELAASRRPEARIALAILGVDSAAIHFRDETDGALHLLPATRRATLVARLTQLLVNVAPAEIFLPSKPDDSTEHEAAFDFVVDAARQNQTHPDIWQFPVWLWWNPLAGLRRMTQAGIRAYAPADHFLVTKEAALASYRSQLNPLPPLPGTPLRGELIRAAPSEAEFFFKFEISRPQRQLATA